MRTGWLGGLVVGAAVLAQLSCADRRPSNLALANDEAALGIVDSLLGQYESFGAQKADVTACRQKLTVVRDAIGAERYEDAQAALRDSLQCAKALGDGVSAQLDALRENHHLGMDLKELLGKDVDFGQGLYKLVRINWTPKGDAVRYDLELRAIPSGLLRTYSFMLR